MFFSMGVPHVATADVRKPLGPDAEAITRIVALMPPTRKFQNWDPGNHIGCLPQSGNYG
jgi:hypothetical protein